MVDFIPCADVDLTLPAPTTLRCQHTLHVICGPRAFSIDLTRASAGRLNAAKFADALWMRCQPAQKLGALLLSIPNGTGSIAGTNDFSLLVTVSLVQHAGLRVIAPTRSHTRRNALAAAPSEVLWVTRLCPRKRKELVRKRFSLCAVFTRSRSHGFQGCASPQEVSLIASFHGIVRAGLYGIGTSSARAIAGSSSSLFLGS